MKLCERCGRLHAPAENDSAMQRRPSPRPLPWEAVIDEPPIHGDVGSPHLLRNAAYRDELTSITGSGPRQAPVAERAFALPPAHVPWETAMIEQPDDDASFCYQHATHCRKRALQARDPSLKAEYLSLEYRWLCLARSYGLSGEVSSSVP